MIKARCFNCEKEIESAVNDESAWDCPAGGSVFHGGGSFGSTVLDSLVDGVGVKLILCDECIKEELKHGLIIEEQA